MTAYDHYPGSIQVLSRFLSFFPILFFSSICWSSLLAQENPADSVSGNTMVSVGDPGNAPYMFLGAQLGEVDYSYQLGMYEQTIQDYRDLLAAVASQPDENNVIDPHGLWNDAMSEWIKQTQNGDGSYSYEVIPGKEKLPITHVTLFSGLRCCNWHEHGAPTLKAGDDIDAITEHGAYEISLDGKTFTPNPHARFVIPSQDEWIKAAYYKGNGVHAGYWNYPTQSESTPGSGSGDVTNQANYNSRSWLSNSLLRLSNVDLFYDSHSFYGCRDMGGNVNEWTTTQDTSGKYIVRGGSYESEYNYIGSNDLMITATPQSYLADDENGLIGFRIEQKNLSAPLAESNHALFTDAITEIQENGAGWTGAESAWAYAVVRGLFNLRPKKYRYMTYYDENGKKLGAPKLEIGETTEDLRYVKGTHLVSQLHNPITKPYYAAELDDFLFSLKHMEYVDQFKRLPSNSFILRDKGEYVFQTRMTMTPERTWYNRTRLTNIGERLGCSTGVFEASKALLINGAAGAVLGVACSYVGEYLGEGVGYLCAGKSGAAEGKEVGGEIGTVMGVIAPWLLL